MYFTIFSSNKKLPCFPRHFIEQAESACNPFIFILYCSWKMRLSLSSSQAKAAREQHLRKRRTCAKTSEENRHGKARGGDQYRQGIPCLPCLPRSGLCGYISGNFRLRGRSQWAADPFAHTNRSGRHSLYRGVHGHIALSAIC